MKERVRVAYFNENQNPLSDSAVRFIISADFRNVHPYLLQALKSGEAIPVRYRRDPTIRIVSREQAENGIEFFLDKDCDSLWP